MSCVSYEIICIDTQNATHTRNELLVQKFEKNQSTFELQTAIYITTILVWDNIKVENHQVIKT